MKVLNILWVVIWIYTLVDFLILYNLKKKKYKALEKILISNALIIRIVFYIYIFKNSWWKNLIGIVRVTPQEIYLFLLSILILVLFYKELSKKDKVKKKYTMLIILEYFFINIIFIFTIHYFFMKGILDVSQYTSDFIF